MWNEIRYSTVLVVVATHSHGKLNEARELETETTGQDQKRVL